MEQIYKIPSKDCSTKKERNIFWDRIIADQKTSGLSAPKFCQKYQIPFSAFRNRQHRLRVKEKQSACGNNEGGYAKAIGRSGFVRVQVADKAMNVISIPKDVGYVEIKIIFKNCNVIEFSLPMATMEGLSIIIAQVAKLSC